MSIPVGSTQPLGNQMPGVDDVEGIRGPRRRLRGGLRAQWARLWALTGGASLVPTKSARRYKPEILLFSHVCSFTTTLPR